MMNQTTANQTLSRIRIGQVRGTGYPIVRVIERQRGRAGEARTLYVIEYLTGVSAGHRETRSRAYVTSLALLPKGTV